MQYETIKVEYSDNIATITLNLPQRLNPLGVKMIHEVMQACDEAEQSKGAGGYLYRCGAVFLRWC